MAKEALTDIREWLAPDDLKYATVRLSFRDALASLDVLIEEALKEEHRVTTLWRNQEKRTSPCPCAECDVDEFNARTSSIREALQEGTVESSDAPTDTQ